jgi:uncharacterized membrane protein
VEQEVAEVVVVVLLAPTINKKMKMKDIFIWIVVIALVVGFIFLKPGLTGKIIISENQIEIPLSQISEKAEFYEVNNIKFFVVKASDGIIKSAFDSCDICHSARKGYRQEGNIMVCNNCGNKYHISGLGTENKNPGGCWPGYLPNYIKANNLIIKISDLNKGKWRFE